MRLEIFGIWDDKAKAYLQPFYMVNKQSALRTFANAVNKQDSQLNVNPEDYTLFALGAFEDSNGVFETQPAELVATALQVRSSKA